MVDLDTDQNILETTRMDLRPLRASDAGPISMFAGDKRVARMTTRIPHPFPPGAAEAYVRASLSDGAKETVWAMDATKSGGAELIGLITLMHRDKDVEEFGYWVGPPFWNTGYAQEAVQAVLAHSAARGVQVWQASVLQENAGSAKVLTNCGFNYQGESEAYSVARRAVVPVWLYERRLNT